MIGFSQSRRDAALRNKRRRPDDGMLRPPTSVMTSDERAAAVKIAVEALAELHDIGSDEQLGGLRHVRYLLSFGALLAEVVRV